MSGSMAQYKGDGTINGAPGYGFLLSAVDGSPDKFRIKIFLKATPNAPIYDNQLGSVDTDAPTTALAGGSIVIHTSKK